MTPHRSGRSSLFRSGVVSTLDFKLGLRMLARYPGLTVVGGLAMTFGVAVGTASLEVLSRIYTPDLPVEEGERVFGILTRNVETGRRDARVVHDYLMWQDRGTAFEELGIAAVPDAVDLVDDDGRGVPVVVTQISASGLALTRATPLLGRLLVESDERPGADPVALVGYDTWQTVMGGERDVLGATIRLGEERATVVGVMPPDFQFPLAEGVWVPLPVDPLSHGREGGPDVLVFGRLAEGVTVEQADAELAGLDLIVATAFPESEIRRRSIVVPFAELFVTMPTLLSPEMFATVLSLVALIVLLAGNVALLMFARAATRERELVIRSALGAGRGRLVRQLFVESLVLSALSVVTGLFFARMLLERGLRVYVEVVGALPYWIDDEMSALTVVWASGLGLAASVVAGVLPGLKATRGIRAGLTGATVGGGVRFGGVWTAVIVAQVAATITFPAFPILLMEEAHGKETIGTTAPLEHYAAAIVSMEHPSDLLLTTDERIVRRQTAHAELERRLQAEPTVRGVSFVDLLPRAYHNWNQVEVAGGMVQTEDPRGHRVARAEITPGFFELFDMPVIAGRSFDARDVGSGARVVVVDEPFVERVLGGRNPVGDVVRYVASEDDPEPATESPYHEIIGVVGDLGMQTGYGRGGIYHAAPESQLGALQLVVRVAGDPHALAPELRRIVMESDPDLRLWNFMTLDEVVEAEQGMYGYWMAITLALSGLALMLSLVGIYSVMSFTAARRTREIGVRIALGAAPRRIVAAVFRLPALQVSAGIGVGALLFWAMSSWLLGGLTLGELALVSLYLGAMLAVCLLACVVPTRRALSVEPTEALRAES